MTAGGRGRPPERREHYLELRRAGLGREDTCREMGIDSFDHQGRLYEKWFAAAGGQTEPARHNPFGLSPFSAPSRALP